MVGVYRPALSRQSPVTLLPLPAGPAFSWIRLPPKKDCCCSGSRRPSALPMLGRLRVRRPLGPALGGRRRLAACGPLWAGSIRLPSSLQIQ